ncbi:MAG: TraB/GumN family protein, partial [Methanomassiliicoccaceae archaeon]|nr:TraB/GumN family protein [Methanomassiliicoccaceae archaeon]
GSSENHSKLNRELAEYQKKIWENSGPRSEDDMLTAIHAGKAIGAQIICIDRDAEQTMSEVEENMSFLERTRFYFSLRRGKMSGAKSMGSMQKQLDANEEEYMRKLRKRFPTFVEKLIDERNTIMAARIKEAAEKYKNIVIVVGDGHVKGICELLDGIKIDKIRLADMMDQERMNEVRSRIWNRKAEESE